MPRRILFGLLLIALAAAAAAQVRSIRNVDIVSRPPRAWDGRCPADLEFIATINANRWPVWVSYRWERSDGARGPVQRVEVRGPHHRVSETWRLGRRGDRLVVWERLHVLAPTNIESMAERVRVVCR